MGRFRLGVQPRGNGERFLRELFRGKGANRRRQQHRARDRFEHEYMGVVHADK